jgi:hypothetical protein
MSRVESPRDVATAIEEFLNVSDATARHLIQGAPKRFWEILRNPPSSPSASPIVGEVGGDGLVDPAGVNVAELDQSLVTDPSRPR